MSNYEGALRFCVWTLNRLVYPSDVVVHSSVELVDKVGVGIWKGRYGGASGYASLGGKLGGHSIDLVEIEPIGSFTM